VSSSALTQAINALTLENADYAYKLKTSQDDLASARKNTCEMATAQNENHTEIGRLKRKHDEELDEIQKKHRITMNSTLAKQSAENKALSLKQIAIISKLRSEIEEMRPKYDMAVLWESQEAEYLKQEQIKNYHREISQPHNAKIHECARRQKEIESVMSHTQKRKMADRVRAMNMGAAAAISGAGGSFFTLQGVPDAECKVRCLLFVLIMI
jgi:hypothetical protein